MPTAERCESHITFATASDLLRPLQWRGFPKRICECAFQDRRLYFRDGHDLSVIIGRLCPEWDSKRQRESGRLHQRPNNAAWTVPLSAAICQNRVWLPSLAFTRAVTQS